MPFSSTDQSFRRDKVRDAYSAASEHPKQKNAFPVGRQFAESIGYPAEFLNRLPAVACDAFAGVSNVSIFADLLTKSLASILKAPVDGLDATFVV